MMLKGRAKLMQELRDDVSERMHAPLGIGYRDPLTPATIEFRPDLLTRLNEATDRIAHDEHAKGQQTSSQLVLDVLLMTAVHSL
jgi:hypothetical protein